MIQSRQQRQKCGCLLLQVEHDIEDLSNALNRLQQQLGKISDAAYEEQVKRGSVLTGCPADGFYKEFVFIVVLTTCFKH